MHCFLLAGFRSYWSYTNSS